MEGMMPNDLTQVMPEGYMVNPPDTRSNTQRIWVPPTAISEFQIIALVGAKRKQPPPPETPPAQETLFP